MKLRIFKLICIVLVILLLLIVGNIVLVKLFPRKYSEQVERFSMRYGIEPNLVYAIIKCESNFKKDSISRAGAIGLMQITPDTLEWASQKNGEKDISSHILYDPTYNIKYGCCIYSLFFNEFNDCTVALAAYNAGRGNVLNWLRSKDYSDDGILLKDIPFKETKRYVSKVQKIKKIYDLLY